jgi:DNA-directed RNA polymerase beta subunit
VCKRLKRPYELADLQIPYACKLLFQELISMNVCPRIELGVGGYFNVETSTYT